VAFTLHELWNKYAEKTDTILKITFGRNTCSHGRLLRTLPAEGGLRVQITVIGNYMYYIGGEGTTLLGIPVSNSVYYTLLDAAGPRGLIGLVAFAPKYKRALP